MGEVDLSLKYHANAWAKKSPLGLTREKSGSGPKSQSPLKRTYLSITPYFSTGL